MNPDYIDVDVDEDHYFIMISRELHQDLKAIMGLDASKELGNLIAVEIENQEYKYEFEKRLK